MVPSRVHLVGSIALDSVQEVFETAGSLLGRRLRRIPDGEPGGRRLWISWQYPLLRSLPFLKADTSHPNQTSGFLPLQLAEGFAPADIRFPELGYAREARASYQDFVATRKEGALPPDVRFQVSLPTPFAVINPFCAPADAPAIEPAYEAAMLREVDSLCQGHPASGSVHPVGCLHRDGHVGRPGAIHSQSLCGSAARNRNPNEAPRSGRA